MTDNEIELAAKQVAIEAAVAQILLALRVSPTDENFKGTPGRVARMYLEMFAGVNDIDKGAIEAILSMRFPSNYSGIVVHNDLLVFSMCPHHLLSVEYSISLAYISPITVGLSKIPRVVELLAKRPVLQETLTEDIAIVINTYLNATGVIVVVRGKHSCMRTRGVRTLSDVVVTSSLKGLFHSDPAAKAEVFQLLQERNQK